MNASRVLLILAFVSLAFVSLAILYSENTPDHIDSTVISEGEYETIVIDTTIDDMKAAGYQILPVSFPLAFWTLSASMPT